MIALFVASCSKLHIYKIIRETTQNASFEQRGLTPYTKMLVFFWFRMVPYGPNINVPAFPRFFFFKKWPFCSTIGHAWTGRRDGSRERRSDAQTDLGQWSGVRWRVEAPGVRCKDSLLSSQLWGVGDLG